MAKAMTGMALVAVAAAALLMGAASGARITGVSPKSLSEGGGMTLFIRGEGFSEDQFNHFDNTMGNRVFLINGDEEIECKVITYLTTANRIACTSGPRTSTATRLYEIAVYVDGDLIQGDVHTVLYVWYKGPRISSVNPRWTLPGSLVTLNGNLRSSTYYKLNYDDPISSDPEAGDVLTKAYVGGVECDFLDENEELVGPLTNNMVTCRSRAKLIGPMNATVYVTNQGVSKMLPEGMYVDSQDKLFQVHTYPGVNSVSPASGSSLGGSLLTINGVGFDPYMEQTKVEVGGAECAIQHVTDDQIQCLTPFKDLTSAGPGERGMLVELYEGEYFESGFWVEESWAALSPSHAGYSSFVTDVAELEFPIDITQDTVGTVKGYLNPPHDGAYALSASVGDSVYITVAIDGNPNNKVKVNQMEEFSLKKGTPAYIEIRFQSRGATEFNLSMRDFHTKFLREQTPRARREIHRVRLDITQKWDVMSIEINGNPAPAYLYLNGLTSSPVDITDPIQVREQLLDMTEQKCEADFSGLDVRHHKDFEDGTQPPGTLGRVVDDVTPFCGRKVLKLQKSNPRIYRVTEPDNMVIANTHKYLCYAVSGNLGKEMAITFVWKDRQNKARENTVEFERVFSSSGWTYHCENLMEVMLNSDFGGQYKIGSKLMVKNVVLPEPLGSADDIYVDEVAFLSSATTVTQTRPSALKHQGILVQDVEVKNEKENGYSLQFVTSNCMNGMPLLGLFENAEVSNEFIETLATATSAEWDLGGVLVNTLRNQIATGPLRGTWDLSIQGQQVKDIPADVHPFVLEGLLESALGTKLNVLYDGSCKNYHYNIEWLQDPGRKELGVVNHKNLVFEGEFRTEVTRELKAALSHYPLPADFVTTHRESPHVTLRVNGYSAACLGNCAFIYDDSTTPTLASVSGTPGEGTQHTLILTGTGFTSSNLDDYSVSVGDKPCSPTAATNTQVTCDLALLGGEHAVILSMQPAGVALSSSPVTYTVPVTVSHISIATGGTGGLYPLTVSGSGFPDAAGWEAGSGKVMIGGKECVVTSGDPTEVTCTVPPGEGVVDVRVNVGGMSDALSSSFTYDVLLSPAITDVSLASLSVYGQEEVTVSGSSFGSSGSVKIGPESCDVTSWSDTSVTCLTPSLSPGTYSLSLFADSLGAASRDVDYVLKITSTSGTKGSVKGGTLLKVGGTGFGSDCSRLEVRLGERYKCEVLECSNDVLTCLTKFVPATHIITNTGSSTEESVSWSPRLLEVVEGDEVTFQWRRLSEISQLMYSVCEVPSPTDSCGDGNGSGFSSGTKTATGSFTVSFPQQGTYYYTGFPITAGGSFVMRGQINVVRPQHQALNIIVTLGGKEATYDLTGNEVISLSDCDPILETSIGGCDVADPPTPEDEYLYFQAHTCYTPVVTAIATSTTHNVPGLSGIQVLGGESLTITGLGFGDMTCHTEVSVGGAKCSVTSVSDTSVTCDLDDLENLKSSAYLPVTVKVINRGSAVIDVDNYNSLGRVVVVPEVYSISPSEGSLAGGTLLTITGSGLQGLSADPVVLLRGKACEVQSVSSTTVTCLTPASATAKSTTLILAVSGISAKMDALTFTYNEALTPVVTRMSIEGEEVTLSGQRFGSDASKLTVTLERQMVSRRRRDVEGKEEQEEEDPMMEQEEEEDEAELMIEEEEIDENFLEDFRDDIDDDEMEYLDEATADVIRSEKSRRHLRRRLKLSLADEMEAPKGFWGAFTGTGAATFEETVRMGAWRIAGTAFVSETEDEDLRERPTRKRRSAEDLPTSYTCTVTSVSGSEASCTCNGLPAGSYTPVVSLDGVGNALTEGASAVAVPVASSMTPASGSTNGGALLAIVGSGFIPGDTSVLVGGVSCLIEEESTNAIACRVASGSEGSVAVVVKVTGSQDVTTLTDFTYSSAFTPTLSSVTPSVDVVAGDTLTLAGTGFTLSGADPVVTVGGENCALTSKSDTSLQCTAPEIAGESYEVVVRDTTHGDSNIQTITFAFSIASITPSSGSFGGAEVTLTGQGFDPAGGSTVTFCDKPCDIASTTSTTGITCVAPKQTTANTPLTCDVVVTIPSGSSFTLPGGYTYDPSLTPSVTSVEPKRGGTAGGTTLTIAGTSFGSSGNVVTVGGSPCVVSSEGPSGITCVTEAHQGPGQFEVKITVPGKGLATTDENGIFYYIDRWSSVFTWGNEPVPSEGQMVFVTKGQTILLDESTPVLKMLTIQGGHVMFDSDAAEELVLRAEYILVVDGGSLSIGSEEEPFTGPAVIELHGNTQSIELPIYGAKVLAVRNGTLDLHGAHVPITWTHLAQTASSGDTTITLALPVSWKAGDQIVIATTEMRFSKNENEVRTIASVSANGQEVTLMEPLEYEHISITQTLGGRVVETRAEVGLLTRNVKVRGAVNSDFTKFIKGCETEWSPDQHSTQSCFNGRFGDELGSDQFGATVMLFGKYPDQELVKGRIEYVEVTEAGQAFQLGRYPIHFHLVGNVDTSYIRGCAVHRTYNRAITIHAANYLTVEHNVVYDNMGHAIFTEDGVEQNNVVQYNLAVYTRSSSSLLNVDVTPSSFWVVNPNNIFRHNAAAGGTHFGYWYRLERHPSGPSATTSYCPNNEQMGEFSNNTAHSMGRYGLWVFSNKGYTPKSSTCKGKDKVAKWHGFTAWHCERGAEAVSGTNLQFHDFVMLDNQLAGMEMVAMSGQYGEDNGPGIFNSVVACHSAINSGACSSKTSGIVAPKSAIFSIADVTFVNFDTNKCSALSGCSQCRDYQGGFRVQVKGLSFDSSPNKLKFKWEHETIWIDADGSLTGEAEANVVPSMGILPPDTCSDDPAFSVENKIPGAVCRGGMKFLRFNVLGPATSPSSLVGRNLLVSNAHGTTYVPYMLERLTTSGWMGILYTGETYDWNFDYSAQITNISYKADWRFVSPNDYFYIRHTLTQEPDGFGTTTNEMESLESLPDPATNVHGDYYWDADAKELTYMVSYKQSTSNKRAVVFDDRNIGFKRSINFRVFRCQYEGCVPPVPPPVPTGRPDTTYRWSDVETWKEVPVGSGGHPTETEYNLPVDGDQIIIPKGMWLTVDTVTPKLGRVYVYGTLEFEDTMDHDFEATIIYIQGGTVIGGMSTDEPFTHNLVIRLRGSLDPDDPDNENFPMPYGVPNVGWKAIGVFGNLKLHGQVTGKTWHKLGATAEIGSTHITLAEAPDASWLNKMVVVTTTAKEATESEVRKVTAIEGATLTLDTPLAFQHLRETHSLVSGTSITLAGEVGLLSRNVVVEGNTYENFAADSFGGRIVVSKFTEDDVHYTGTAQLDGVELRNMGQEGFTDLNDPHYSLVYVGLGTIEDDSSYVKRSSFNLNYNMALGLLGTSNMQVEENVIYYAIDAGVMDTSGSNMYRKNLITTVLFLGTYGDRWEDENYNWNGAFQLDSAPNTVLIGNVVAGAEQAGYKTLGEPCEDETLWTNNEVHSTVYGVMSWKKGSLGPWTDCRRINNFYAWRISATAFYYQYYASSFITDVVSVDNPLGVNQLIYNPTALSHLFYPKTANITYSLFVGASPSHSCTYQKSKSDIEKFYGGRLWSGGVDGGNTAMVFGSFTSGTNMAPKMSFSPAGTYPALYGSTHIKDVTFFNYGDTSCGRDIALLANPGSEDAIHPIFVEGLKFFETPEENYLFIPRANLGSVNPSDCVDMDCDGHKKVMLRDMDGTLLGTSDATVISQAEYEWDGDPSRGVGDYRIPVSLRQREDGSEIDAVDKFPNKGIVRDASCSVFPSWQAWKCTSLSHRMMVIESMDSDTEVRRLSPIALIANPGPNGYVDLLNGPKDNGWCFGYTCQERISTFYSVVAAGRTYEMAMTSTPPQVLRLHLLHAPSSEAVVLRIFFPKPQRYDIYVDDTFVPPTNIDENAEGYQLIPENPDDSDAFFPTLDDDVGTNYFQRSAKLVHVVLRGGHVIDIKTTPMITLTSGLVVAEDDFFEQNLQSNLADLFGVSKENIRITNIVREDSRRRSRRQATVLAEVSAEIASAPTTSLDGGEDTGAISGEVIPYEKLVEDLETAVNKFQDGSCELCASLKVNDPVEPPQKAPPKATPETGSVIIEGGELFSNKQQKEEGEALEKSLETTEYAQPTSVVLLRGVSSEVVQYTAFEMQPSVTVLNDQGETVNDLGHKSDPWRVTAQLSGGSGNAVLTGTTTVPYMDGSATFTDLSVSEPGEGYSLTFTITYPNDAPALSTALDETFSARPMSVAMVLQHPELVQASQPTALSVQFVDKDSRLALDGEAFKDQTFVGEVLAKTGDGDFEVIKRIYSEEKATSTLILEDITFEEPSVRYQLVVKVAVLPAGWYMEFDLPRLVVYPANLVVQKNAITRAVHTDLYRWKIVEGVEDQLEDGVMEVVMNSVDMMAEGVYFGPVTVTLQRIGNKRGKATFTITGPEDSVATALGKLCEALRSNVAVPIQYKCSKTLYNMRKIYVEGQVLRCSMRSIRHHLGKAASRDSLQDVMINPMALSMGDAAAITDLSISSRGVANLMSAIPRGAPALKTALSPSTRMNKEIVLQYPDILRAGHPLVFSLLFMSDNSPLDGEMFRDQKIVGEVLGKSGDEEFQVIKRIYLVDNDVSTVTIDDVTIGGASVRYQLAAKVSVVPAGWYMDFVSPRLMVYPDNLMVQENSITKAVQVYIMRWGNAVEGVENELEDGMMKLLMKTVDMMDEGVYWGPVTVMLVEAGKKRANADFTVTGPEDSVTTALEKLCQELRQHVLIQIHYNCKKLNYYARKVFVDGEGFKCSKKNTNQRSEEAAIHDLLHQPARFGRHKFNRG